MTPDNREELERTCKNLTNQTPDEDQIARIEGLREVAKLFAEKIYEATPRRSRERSLALTNLEQTTMWAVAAIAREKL